MALNTFTFLKQKKRFWWGLKAEKALIETKFFLTQGGNGQ
jgi:hypothetical protein